MPDAPAPYDTFDFVVPTAFGPLPPKAPPDARPPEKEWLTLGGKTTTTRSVAASFVFRLYATGREEGSILMRIDELNGSAEQTIDIDLAIQQTRVQLRHEIEVDLWGDPNNPAVVGTLGEGGKPETEDETERTAIEDAVAKEWNVSRPTRLRLQHLADLRDRQRVLAEWKVLAERVPAGWEDLAERRLRPDLLQAILLAYSRARWTAENASGK